MEDISAETVPQQRPVRYELIDKEGRKRAEASTAEFLGGVAKTLWPDQEQDPERSGKGWDIQIAGVC